MEDHNRSKQLKIEPSQKTFANDPGVFTDIQDVVFENQKTTDSKSHPPVQLSKQQQQRQKFSIVERRQVLPHKDFKSTLFMASMLDPRWYASLASQKARFSRDVVRIQTGYEIVISCSFHESCNAFVDLLKSKLGSRYTIFNLWESNDDRRREALICNSKHLIGYLDRNYQQETDLILAYKEGVHIIPVIGTEKYLIDELLKCIVEHCSPSIPCSYNWDKLIESIRKNLETYSSSNDTANAKIFLPIPVDNSSNSTVS